MHLPPLAALQKPRVKVSLAAVYAFMFIGWPLLIYYTGIGGWAKYWLMPWLGYHFWMSTFTLVHHTSPHIPFKGAENWNPAQAQLAGTVHCDYPSWSVAPLALVCACACSTFDGGHAEHPTLVLVSRSPAYLWGCQAALG